MGLAASQARLLSLTSRQHTLEHRAQFLQAQKLRLANDSDRVYEKYIEALDSTKLETRMVTPDNKVHWVDGSLNNLMRYGSEAKNRNQIYFVQDIKTGKLLVPEKLGKAFDQADGNMLRFMDLMGVGYTTGVHTQAYIDAEIDLNYAISQGWDSTAPFDNDFLSEYSRLKGLVSSPPKSDIYERANTISGIMAYKSNSQTGRNVYLPAYETQYNALMINLKELSENTNYFNNRDVKALIEYCLNFKLTDFDDFKELHNEAEREINKKYKNDHSITQEEKDKEIEELFKEKVNSIKATIINERPLYLNYDKEKLKASDAENPYITDKDLLTLLLNGGRYILNGSDKVKDVYKNGDTDGSDKDMDEEKKQLSNGKTVLETLQSYFNVGEDFVNLNIGDFLTNITEHIKTSELEKERSIHENELNNLLSTQGTTRKEVDTVLNHYKKYQTYKLHFELQDTTTHTEYHDSNLGEYYEYIFSALQASDGYKVLEDSYAKSSTWVHNMIKNAQVVLATYNVETKEIDNTTPSTSSGVREVSNTEKVKQADIEYETDLEAINTKDSQYNTQLQQLETERSAIKQEIESLKKIAQDNVANTFNLFS